MNIDYLIRALPRPLRRHKLIRALLFFFPSSKIQKIYLDNGSGFFGDLSELGPRSALLHGNPDPEFIEIATKFLSGTSSSKTFFDIGANYGVYSFYLCPLLSDVEFHLFEANPTLCDLLNKSTFIHKEHKINVVNACVTSSNHGCSRLKVDKVNNGASYISSDDGDFVVKNLSLGSYIRENNISEVDFAKLDIEGFEVEALEGVLKSDKRCVIKAFVMEVVSSHLNRANTSTEKLFSMLLSSGYMLFHFRNYDFNKYPYNSFIVDKDKRKTYSIYGNELQLAQLDMELACNWGFGTDLLVVHESLDDFKLIA